MDLGFRPPRMQGVWAARCLRTRDDGLTRSTRPRVISAATASTPAGSQAASRLVEEPRRGLDLVLFDEHDLEAKVLDHFTEFPGNGALGPSAIERASTGTDRPAAARQSWPGTLTAPPDDPDARQGSCDSSDEAPAPDRHEDHVDVGHVLAISRPTCPGPSVRGPSKGWMNVPRLHAKLLSRANTSQAPQLEVDRSSYPGCCDLGRRAVFHITRSARGLERSA